MQQTLSKGEKIGKIRANFLKTLFTRGVGMPPYEIVALQAVYVNLEPIDNHRSDKGDFGALILARMCATIGTKVYNSLFKPYFNWNYAGKGTTLQEMALNILNNSEEIKAELRRLKYEHTKEIRSRGLDNDNPLYSTVEAIWDNVSARMDNLLSEPLVEWADNFETDLAKSGI